MALTGYIPDPEELGRRRFPDYKAFRKDLNNRSLNILSVLQSLFASNYPKEPITNLALWNRVMATEFARINWSIEAINNDKQYSQTRIQYLQQILGERLFLNEQIAPVNYNDISYRDYLISIKDAYLKGSKKTDIEALASKFTGLRVDIRELYLEARNPTSSYGLIDTHKMVVEVFVDDLLKKGFDINKLKKDLNFFIGLTRPAHVLYDTKFIWTEQLDTNKVFDVYFGDTGGGCIPEYDYIPFDQATLKALLIFILPTSEGAMGQIDSVYYNDLMFYLDDATRVIVEPGINGTKIFNAKGRQVSFNSIEVGQYVRIVHQTIPGHFQFWWYPDFLFGDNWYSQFYRNIYQRPAFQEFVKKRMDARGRFPLQIKTTPTTLCDRWVHDVLQPLYEDMRSSCSSTDRVGRFSSELREHMQYPRLSWPYERGEVTDPEKLGSSYVIHLKNTPITDSSGNPAGTSDVSVYFDGTILSNSIIALDASTGLLQLTDSTNYWNSSIGKCPVPGDSLTFSYYYLSDGTVYNTEDGKVFGIAYWQMPQTPLVNGDSSGTLANPKNIALSVDGTSITGAVIETNPLLGHVRLNDSSDFWMMSGLGRFPVIGDIFSFTYFWGDKYEYSALFDDLTRPMDSYTGYLYGIVIDMDLGSNPETDAVEPLQPYLIGYRYRTYLLHHSSVLNSPDTLNLNTYQKPVKRASIKNQSEVLNHFNIFFSPEFLNDKNKIDTLNDRYLTNGLDPVLKLQKGTPPFQKTFGFQPRLIEERKLQDIRSHHHPLMYSDLLLKEFHVSGEDIPISPVCESERTEFRFGMKETVPPLSECEPWILFDTFETKEEVVNIPGEFRGIPNIRVADKRLRDNLILRELEPSGVASFTYTVTTTIDNPATTVFQLPLSFSYDIGEDVIDFPAVPIMKDASTLAEPSDVSVTIDGEPWPVVSVDPVRGIVQLQDFPELKKIETQVTLTEGDIGRSSVYLPGIPLEPSFVTLTVIRGTAQYYGEDYYVSGRELIWFGTDLEGLLEVGDTIRVSYEVNPLIAARIEFRYKILSSQTVHITDIGRSRIMDNGHVLGGYCPDGPQINVNTQFNEYFTFLSDYSEGIKISYFNKSTAMIEDHVFEGPVFEYYDPSEDEIGVPENFPNALIRIRNPLLGGNPLQVRMDYRFMDDSLVRFRKKTFKELLPDRTFRTIKITEMLPV